MAYLWIGLGSALGGMTRHAIGEIFLRQTGGAFPWGTLFVNVTGSFLIGLLTALALQPDSMFSSSTARWFLVVGLLGGYTTFSAFSLQSLQLAQRGDWLLFFLYVSGSVLLCLLAVGSAFHWVRS
jgi:fluoride exporter